MLSVRVDSVDRRLVQLETVERRVNELADMNRRLADLTHLDQRITDLEQSRLTADCNKPETVDGLSDVGDTVPSLTDDVDALRKQMNNLLARMTLAENQLMLQVAFI